MDPDKRVLTGIKPLPWSYQQIGINHLWRKPYSSIFFSFKNHTTNAFDVIKLNRLIFVPKCIITAFLKKIHFVPVCVSWTFTRFNQN